MADHFKGGKVSNISRKDFDASFKLKKSPGKNSLIVFHQPWCGFCVQLAPEYKKISTKVYSVNGELPGSDELFAHFGVTGFPTIRFLSKDGKVGSKTYLGERDASSMMKFIKSAGMSGGGKKKVVKKKKCVGKSCNGKCKNGKCKKVQKGAKKCKKCKGKCIGKQCKKQKGAKKRGRPRDVPMKKLETAVIKSLKKIKKMLGGKKKKPAKKSIKKRKPKRKTIKKRGKK
jgi:thioredoxin-related protein